jgi:hypothetical protein
MEQLVDAMKPIMVDRRRQRGKHAAPVMPAHENVPLDRDAGHE